jgi:hypothetical protein
MHPFGCVGALQRKSIQDKAARESSKHTTPAAIIPYLPQRWNKDHGISSRLDIPGDIDTPLGPIVVVVPPFESLGDGRSLAGGWPTASKRKRMKTLRMGRWRSISRWDCSARETGEPDSN